jgi:hypothetical protein
MVRTPCECFAELEQLRPFFAFAVEATVTSRAAVATMIVRVFFLMGVRVLI